MSEPHASDYQTFMLDLLRLANRKTRNSRALRKFGVWAYSSAVRANVFLPPPKVFLNGPGKSGTHLLSDCLSLLPRMMFSGRHFSLAEFVVPPARPDDLQFSVSEPFLPLDTDRLGRLLRGCRNGTFVSAHAGFHPALQQALQRFHYKHVLLLRDPRDVAVSYTFFVMREPGHHHHHYYRHELRSDDERLMATIRGFAGTQAVQALASIGTTFERFVPWIDEPGVLVCRFEDLVGARGGGNRDLQNDEIRRVAAFVGRPVTAERAAAVAAAMYSEKSLTFRKGALGQWAEHFGEAHRAAFKEVANPVLLRLGYEVDGGW